MKYDDMDDHKPGRKAGSSAAKRKEIQERAAKAKAEGLAAPKRDEVAKAEQVAAKAEQEATEARKEEELRMSKEQAMEDEIAELKSKLETELKEKAVQVATKAAETKAAPARQERSTDRDVRKGRKARGPMGGSVQKLACTEIAGYNLRWVNDEPGRVQQFLGNDYEHVTLDDVEKYGLQVGHGAIDGNEGLGAKVSSVVGTNPNGSEKRAYLMKIPSDYYVDDQKAKMKAIDESEAQYKEGDVNIPDSVRYKPQENTV